MPRSLSYSSIYKVLCLLLQSKMLFSSLGRGERVIKYGVSFSPAGLLTPFHLGASAQLQKLGIITPDTALAGSSGGALAAVTSALEVSKKVVRTAENDPLLASIYIAKQCRDNGARLTLRTALDVVLDKVLPSNVHSILSNRPAPVIVSYTEVNLNFNFNLNLNLNSFFSSFESGKVNLPLSPAESSTDVSNVLVPRYVTSFTSKNDVMDCLRASCNIPYYFNGNNLYVTAREKNCIDGFFAVSLNRFGCPPTPAKVREILVCPYSAKLVQLNPNKPNGFRSSLANFLNAYRNLVKNIVDIYNYGSSTNTTSPPSALTSNIPVNPNPVPSSSSLSEVEYEMISPDLLDEKDWPFSTQEVIKMSLTAPDSTIHPSEPISDEELTEKYELLYKAGEEAVKKWYAQRKW